MLNFIKKIIRVSLVVLLFATNAYAIPFSAISQIYIFGDSLSDSGFNNLMTEDFPGKAPTFTTFGGYTWAQYVARDIKGYTLPTSYPVTPETDKITNNTTPINGTSYGAVDPTLTGINYACGGSTTNSIPGVLPWAPTLHQQVSHYLETAPATLDPNGVYFIWSGANDILTTLSESTTPTELQLLRTVHTASINIANEVAALSARGAKRFVIFSLPNLGSSPFVTSLPDKSLPAKMKTLSFTYNSMLNTQLGKVIKSHSIKVMFIDAYTLLDSIIAATQAGQPYTVGGRTFTFTNYQDEACSPAISLFCDNNGRTGYMFADAVHPTDLSHQLIATYVEDLIQKWA
jgi:outer membrane lipase/esterase